MKLIYLACPYTDPDLEVRAMRLQIADYVAARIVEETGDAVFSPLTHGARLEPHLSRAKVESHDFWMGQCYAILRRCDELIVLNIQGTEESKGVKLEIAMAQLLSIPIVHVGFVEGELEWL